MLCNFNKSFGHNAHKLHSFISIAGFWGQISSVVIALLLLPAGAALAQAPEIGGLLPAGGLRGEVTRVRIDGKSLAGAKVHLSGGGVSVKSVEITPDGNRLSVAIAVDSSAQLGPHEVRLTTSKGVSNGSRFWVDLYPNKVLETPMTEAMPPIELDGSKPVVLNGRIAVKSGRDRFALTAAAGDTWAFDSFANRIRSRFDPVLELRDATGVSMKLVQSTWESDPRFVYRFAKAGRYILSVRDSEYNGSPNYTYRLLAGRMGFVSGFSPRGDRPGHSVQLALEGTNLGVRQAAISIPSDAKPGIFWAEVKQDAASSIMVPLLVEDVGVISAGAGDAVQPLPPLPAAIDGTFAIAPRRRFTFHAAAKSGYIFDLLGRRIGSRIDGQIRILNASGKEIALVDDAPGLGKEARLEFAAPADGDYTVEVSDVEEMTGPECFYRLEASHVTPNYRLSIETDRLAVPVGGTIAIPVTLERSGGFAEAVEVKVEGVPVGVIARGGTIPAGKTAIEVTLTAAPGTAISASGVHIVGVGSIAGKQMVREAPGWERYEHRSVDLLLSVEYTYVRPHNLWDMLMVGVTDRTDAITFTPPPMALTLAPGASIEIPIHVDRQANGQKEITLELRGLPAKVTVKAKPIPAGQTEGKIILTAAPDTAPDLSTILVVGHHENSNTLAPSIQLSVHK